ncbi:cupin domain-containing protein [Robertmurraya beringensis]|uniref:Cupin domain-containing protein n=1 Tax=Robertmurraya beringensis TaxID=641660 RepID=A0ABV6KW99_9BACI
MMQKQSLSTFITYNEGKFTKRVIFKEGESTVFVLNFSKNQALPAHKHPGTNVFIQVVEGEGTFHVDGESLAVAKHDVIHFTGEEEMSFVNGKGNTSLYVMLNKIPDERYVKEI